MRLGSRIIYVQYAYCRKVKKSFVKNLRMGEWGKSFEENLGMSEWAPLPDCRSSATPLPLPTRYTMPLWGVLPCLPYVYQCVQCVRARALQNRTTVLFYRIERPCFFIPREALSISGFVYQCG